jgi:protoheme IX farnesyltransferase
VFRKREGDAARRASIRLFVYSIVYLFALFLVIGAERVLHFAAAV